MQVVIVYVAGSEKGVAAVGCSTTISRTSFAYFLKSGFQFVASFALRVSAFISDNVSMK